MSQNGQSPFPVAEQDFQEQNRWELACTIMALMAPDRARFKPFLLQVPRSERVRNKVMLIRLMELVDAEFAEVAKRVLFFAQRKGQQMGFEEIFDLIMPDVQVASIDGGEYKIFHCFVPDEEMIEILCKDKCIYCSELRQQE